jgi:hypothetical protein
MKIKAQKSRLVTAFIFFIPAWSYALSQPTFTLTPTTPTTIQVPINSTVTVSYTLTNQTSVARTLTMRPITGITQDTSGDNCANPITLAPKTSCLLSLNIDGSQIAQHIASGPVVCISTGPDNTPDPFLCSQPSQTNSLNITQTTAPAETTLSESVSTLALSVSGNARTITLTNTGSNPANNVTYTASPALPTGTTITPESCDTIAATETCVLTITPGATPSATPGDTSPVPITLTVLGNNTNTLTPTLNILTQGSVYQSGYVYAIDDTTPTTGSMGGKAVTLTNQAEAYPNGIIWSPDNVSIFGISWISTESNPDPDTGQVSGQNACNGKNDGACDTNNIVTYYSPPTTDPATDLTTYAAGLCKATIDNYSDWYLPAICEMSTRESRPCENSPRNSAINYLVQLGYITNLEGYFFSSTGSQDQPETYAFFQIFSTGENNQGEAPKEYKLGVRCSRALTL